MKKQIFWSSYFLILFVGTALLSVTGCDAILPDEFKQKEFALPEIDARAHMLLSRQVSRGAAGKIIADSLSRIATTRTLRELVDSLTRANNTDNQIIHSRFANLADSLKPGVVKDSIMLMVYPRNQTIIYSSVQINAGQSGDFYLYTSLESYQGNSKEYVSVELVKNDTSTIGMLNTMPMEVISGTISRKSFSGEERIIRLIKARYQFHLNEGSYLIRFTLSDPATLSDPSLPLQAPLFFKVLVLPK